MNYGLQETRRKVRSNNVNSYVAFNTLESDSFNKINTLFSNAIQIDMSRAISSSLIEVNLSLLDSVQVEIPNGVSESNFQSNLDNSVNMAMLDMSTNGQSQSPTSRFR